MLQEDDSKNAPSVLSFPVSTSRLKAGLHKRPSGTCLYINLSSSSGQFSTNIQIW